MKQRILKRWSPFPEVDGRYGAPMGRHGDSAASWDGTGVLCARHCGGDGTYDIGGAYWGHSRVYAVWTKGRGRIFCTYVAARGTQDAINIVTKLSKGEE